MGGGKSKEQKVAPVTAPVFNTAGQNQGYQPTPQTFTQAGRPQWMQGHFAMPSWGMRADDPTQQVTPAMLDPRTAMFAQRDAYNAIGNPWAQQAPGSVEEAISRYAGQSSQLPVGGGMSPGQYQVPLAGGGKAGRAREQFRPLLDQVSQQSGINPAAYERFYDPRHQAYQDMNAWAAMSEQPQNQAQYATQGGG
jgi:hypothetical protein